MKVPMPASAVATISIVKVKKQGASSGTGVGSGAQTSRNSLKIVSKKSIGAENIILKKSQSPRLYPGANGFNTTTNVASA